MSWALVTEIHLLFYVEAARFFGAFARLGKIPLACAQAGPNVLECDILVAPSHQVPEAF